MSTVKFWGIAWVLAGGVMNGSFVLPMKKMTGWRWENIWLPYSVVAMVIIPWSFALATVPGLAAECPVRDDGLRRLWWCKQCTAADPACRL